MGTHLFGSPCILSGVLRIEFSTCISKECMKHINNFSVDSNEILVYFDVVSLFTYVLVNKILLYFKSSLI